MISRTKKNTIKNTIKLLFCHALLVGKNQNKYNIITQTIIIATKLVKNNKKLPWIIEKSKKYIQIQTTESGGKSETAIVTPAIVSSNFLIHKDKKANAHENKATKRSRIVGEILDVISGVIWENGTIIETNTLDIIATKILSNNIFILLKYIFLWPFVIANDNDFIGYKSGEINIAQIVTGIEFINNHNAAITQAKNSCIQYSLVEYESFIICCAISLFLESSNFNNAILSKNLVDLPTLHFLLESAPTSTPSHSCTLSLISISFFSRSELVSHSNHQILIRFQIFIKTFTKYKSIQLYTKT